MKNRIAQIVLTAAGLLACSSAGAQLRWLHTVNDTAYISDHTDDLTVRIYGSRKYTSFHIINGNEKEKEGLYYRPNDRFNIGFGVNYKFAGINIGFNLPFINNDNDIYGRTRYLDLQSHLYLRKTVLDFYGHFYKGYYISSPEYAPNFSGVRKPYRPDMRTYNVGLNLQYVFNDTRFSYRASFLQNEYQKKSAGSFLVGGSVYATRVKADSSIVRQELSDRYNYNKSVVVSLSGNAGYAHTFVIRKHFFVTASLVGGIGINHTTITDDAADTVTKGLGLHTEYTFRFAAGYNSELYYAGFQVVSLTARDNAPLGSLAQEWGTGNVRINFARRFKVRSKLRYIF